MNPWDLSCRPKLPLGHLNELKLGANATSISSAAAAVAAASNTLRLALPSSLVSASSHHHHQHHHHHHHLEATVSVAYSTTAAAASPPVFSYSSSSAASPPFTSSSSTFTLSSPSSSINSSRSNSTVTSDDIQLGPTLGNRGVVTNMFSEHEAQQQETPPDNPLDQTPASPQDATTTTSCSLDRKARKKDQNRRAAYNYRRKKMEEKNRIREEEMRLVYSRVCLIGHAEELESSIIYILSTKTKRILDKDGNVISFICPLCLQSCDNILDLRSHLKAIHSPN